MRQEHRLVVILGPTASGKTQLAVNVAAKVNGAVISADSRQVYRDMDIGTGKDLDEYVVDSRPIPRYLIDIVDAGSKYNIFQYAQDYLDACQEIKQMHYQPILCGGSGLYLETALKGHRLAAVPINPSLRGNLEKQTKESLAIQLQAFPESMREHADYSSHKRLIRAIEIATFLKEGNPLPPMPTMPYAENPIIIGMKIDRETRRNRITERLEARLDQGLIQEVETLLQKGIPPETLAYYGLEYKWVSAFVTGQIDRDTMFQKLNTGIHRFAKRQMTWFRKMEKDGWHISWINAMSPLEVKVAKVLNLMRNR